MRYLRSARTSFLGSCTTRFCHRRLTLLMSFRVAELSLVPLVTPLFPLSPPSQPTPQTAASETDKGSRRPLSQRQAGAERRRRSGYREYRDAWTRPRRSGIHGSPQYKDSCGRRVSFVSSPALGRQQVKVDVAQGAMGSRGCCQVDRQGRRVFLLPRHYRFRTV